MNLDEVKKWWDECPAITRLSFEETVCLTETVDNLIAEVERLNAENRGLFNISEHRAAETAFVERQLESIQGTVNQISAENTNLRVASRAVIGHMVGRVPTRGWLRDNDQSRAALNLLVNAAESVQPTLADFNSRPCIWGTDKECSRDCPGCKFGGDSGMM